MCPRKAALVKGKVHHFGAEEHLRPRSEVLERVEAQPAPFALHHVAVTHRAAGAHLQDTILTWH